MAEKIKKNPPAGGPGAAQPGASMADLKANGAAIGRVLKYVFEGYGLALVVVVACILIAAVVQVQMSLFTGELIDSYVLPLLSGSMEGFGPLASKLLQMACIFGVGVVAAYAYNRIMVNVSQGTMLRLRKDVFGSMESLPLRYFDTHQHGDIMSVYTNDIDTLRQMLSQSLPQLVSSAVSLVATLLSMIMLSWQLTLLSLAMVAVMLKAAGVAGGSAGTYFAAQQTDLGKVNAYIEEMVEGQRVVKVFCHEAQAEAGFRKVNQTLRASATNANVYSGMLMPIMANLGNISYVLCAIVGGWLALSGGALTLGALVSFLTLNKNFSQPITQISQQFSSIIMAGAGAARVFALMDEEPEVDDGYVTLVNAQRDAAGALVEAHERTGLWAWKHPHTSTGTTSYEELKGAIVLDDVDFGYTPEKTVLHNIDIFAEPGQKIALVGSTGAGKTTITNLINRFYDIDDGKIRYDGINVNKIKKADLRRSLGIVLQDTHLFSGSILENIRYGRLDASDEECIEAAKRVSADGFIRRLPEGYSTVITGDGGSLSAGQRQLIAIARAAVADPPVLILDEATSSIDTRTEQLVQRGMDALMAGRTSFVIAHRLSTVKNSDCIMVMEQGRIIERGNHEKLMVEHGRYWQLYTGGTME